jgi:CRISPR-associated endonuclease/helicase Cas3
MQLLAGELNLLAGPQLALIEDGTGSGKTEAALLLAARMMAAGLGEGVYLALPTMATANAMYARLKVAISGLFDESGSRPASLVLAHGQTKLASALSQLGTQPTEQAVGPVADRLNRWIADSRKKTFLADIGVGTIDQAFLSILRKKHLTLRQYALAGRILIIDEAHAYDAYMGEELKTLLEMQSRLGGSAIVLSATLPQQKRRDFAVAFARGAGLKDGRGEWKKLENSLSSAAYPLLTHCGAGQAREIAPVPLPELAREVKVQRLPDRAAAIASVLDAAAKGAAVAIICNAVDEANATFDQLRTHLQEDKAHLFHARFGMGDRIRIERALMARFGPESTPVQRAGHVIVATQVIEQSLDLDFDLIITDLAPVDLIIQRAGRLWRHRRVQRPLKSPVIQIISPDPAGVRDHRWLDETLGAAAKVYQLPGVMWRSARVLFAAGSIASPHNLRPMIEAVYGPDNEALPENIVGADERAEGKAFGEKALGQLNTIDPRKGYGEVQIQGADEDIGTRLGEPTVTLRLARRLGGTLLPWFYQEGADETLNWALSEISVRKRWLGDPPPSPADQASVKATKACWPEWEQEILLYEVGGAGELQLREPISFHYDAQTGLARRRREPTG